MFKFRWKLKEKFKWIRYLFIAIILLICLYFSFPKILGAENVDIMDIKYVGRSSWGHPVEIYSLVISAKDKEYPNSITYCIFNNVEAILFKDYQLKKDRKGKIIKKRIFLYKFYEFELID
jgi:hypothetical protein